MSAEDARLAIPGIVRMISGCEDKQCSADGFHLPDPAGRSGGALTAALLETTYADHHDSGKDLTFKETLVAVRGKLQEKGFDQIPQLSSSRPTNLDETFTLLPDNFSGKCFALLVGINYVGQSGELSGCHNDCLNMKEYIMQCHGFEEDDILLLLDDGEHPPPTGDNILTMMHKIATFAESGDALFLHYSGHGASVPDDDGDEEDGMDECLCPVDFRENGIIRDDLVFNVLMGRLRAGVMLTCVMDCCHSGTILDLPYHFVADGKMQDMELDKDYNFKSISDMVGSFVCSGVDTLKKFRASNVARHQRRRQWLYKTLFG